MPELPEVETVRRGLARVMVGGVVGRVELRRANLRFPFPKDFAARLEGQQIESLSRRAKYILGHLSSGDTLAMHLGMSGRFLIGGPSIGHNSAAAPDAFVHEPGGRDKHDHVVFHMNSGATVTYNDVRRFGFMTIVEPDGLADHTLFRNIGPEPLSRAFNARYMAKFAASRQSDLKAFLMDQKTVAGLGNIYVCEALHMAGLSPKRRASSLMQRSGKPAARAERLVDAIKVILRDAIAAGGSTLRDHRQTDGSLGYFQHAFRVYGRESEVCQTAGCTGLVRRIVQSGRSTFYCGGCQR